MEYYKRPCCCKPITSRKCSTNLNKIKPNQLLKCSKEINELHKTGAEIYICSSCSLNLIKKPETAIEAQASLPPTKVAKYSPSSEDSSSDSASSTQSDTDNTFLLQTVNRVIVESGQSPIYPAKVDDRLKHQIQKMQNISANVLGVSGIEPIITPEQVQKAKFFDEIITQLKEKFLILTENRDKIQLLTVLPMSMGTQSIIKEFSCTEHMVVTAKQLQRENGALSKPKPKKGNPINMEIKKKVADFYEDDEISRQLPGKNDCLKVYCEETKSKETKQKRLMLGTLKESYEEFKKVYPNDRIGFSKFAQFRPKHCVQPGSNGTHTVCVCTIHQNVKLMIDAIKLNVISQGYLKSYKDCIGLSLCEKPDSQCYLLNCSKCPGTNRLQDKLQTILEENGYENAEIKFNQWVSTDRCDLETYIKPTKDFLLYFIEKIKKLIPHFFIASEQSKFAKDKKKTLKPEKEFLVFMDFSENYSFIAQNSAQGHHWNKKQATIHPFVIYYCNKDNEVQHLSFIVISECLIHDSVAVKTFIDKLIEYLKSKFDVIEKIYYMTDGAASQYKNRKNFININKHKDDYDGIECEWHFHATSHGKGPCDGIGGTLKRKATRDSLTEEFSNSISNPLQLYNWATDKFNMDFSYITNQEYEDKERLLETRFKLLRTIKGTQTLHAIIPSSNNKLEVKRFSNDEDSKFYKI